MITNSTKSTPLGPILQRYFLSYLVGQRNVSQRTIAAYRDTFRLFLRFLLQRCKLQTESLVIGDLNSARIIAFLEDLEKSRSNCARSRNARLAALRSFMKYAASEDPELLSTAQQVLSIPVKRHDRAAISHLTREQMQALISACAGSTVAAERDKVLLMLLYNTGARVSEIATLRIEDVSLDLNASVKIQGKGRKERTVPLWKQTIKLLRPWLTRNGATAESPLLPNAHGKPMTRFGIGQRLRQATAKAALKDPAFNKLRVSPHTIRHTTAMHLLQSGVDLSVIALWLGHENIQTTHGYLAADLELKKQALACLKHPRVRQSHVAPVPILKFLESL
jgi:integrase/recombinase XerD